MKIEYRSFGVSAVMAGDEGKITGLAAPFNSQTMIGEKPWGFREQVAPGAFAKTLQEADVVFLLNHDTSKPLARKSAGTLNLRESERGLEAEASPPDTTYANDLRTNIKAGNIRGMSFGFEVVKDEWFDDEGQPADKYTGTQRVLKEVKLIEVSAVTFPAYGDTAISARDAVSAARDERAKSKGSKKPYGNVTYADPKNGKYPVDTEKHAKAAWSYINMPKNAAKYPLNGVSLASVKAKIRAALKKFGVKISEENEEQLAIEWRAELEAVETAETRLKDGTKKRIPEIDADLRAALDLFSNAKIHKLPKKAQQAIALVVSAKQHSAHIMDAEGLDPDAGGDDRATSEPDNNESTPATPESDDALRASFAEARSRGAKLGF